MSMIVTTADYVLPTGKQINPAKPQKAYFYDEGQTALVLQRLDSKRTRPTRVITTHGNWDSTDQLGDRLDCYHDQSNAHLGLYLVVGRHEFKSGRKEGIVPNRKIPHSVYK